MLGTIQKIIICSFKVKSWIVTALVYKIRELKKPNKNLPVTCIYIYTLFTPSFFCTDCQMIDLSSFLPSLMLKPCPCFSVLPSLWGNTLKTVLGRLLPLKDGTCNYWISKETVLSRSLTGILNFLAIGRLN